MIRLLAGAMLSVSAAVPVIPWLDQRPPRTAEPPLAQPCDAGALHATVFLQGATGMLLGGVTLRNTARTNCSLRGRVQVRFVGATADGTRWETVAGPA